MKTYRRFMLYAAVVTGISMAAGSSTGPAVLIAATPAETAVGSDPSESGGATAGCYWCSSFGGSHILSSDPCWVGAGSGCVECDDSEFNGDNPPCHTGFDQPGGCSVHEPCEMTKMSQEENALLIAAVRRNDVKTVRAIIDAKPGTLRLNEDRGLLQWFDCAGGVHSQIALSDLLLEKL